jgi:hypothetical protein
MKQVDFEADQKGIKLSYLRFISDSASGIIFFLFLFVAYRFKFPMPFLGSEWTILVPTNIVENYKLFFMILIFLLSSPIGLVINAASWFLLGFFQENLGKLLLIIPTKIPHFLGTTKSSYNYDQILNFFSLSKTQGWKCWKRAKRIYEDAELSEKFISIYFPYLHFKTDHIKGVSRFTRNNTLLFLSSSIYVFFAKIFSFSKDFEITFYVALYLFILALLFFLLNGLVKAFYWIVNLNTLYVLCKSENIQPKNIENCVKELVKISPK